MKCWCIPLSHLKFIFIPEQMFSSVGQEFRFYPFRCKMTKAGVRMLLRDCKNVAQGIKNFFSQLLRNYCAEGILPRRTFKHSAVKCFATLRVHRQYLSPHLNSRRNTSTLHPLRALLVFATTALNYLEVYAVKACASFVLSLYLASVISAIF